MVVWLLAEHGHRLGVIQWKAKSVVGSGTCWCVIVTVLSKLIGAWQVPGLDCVCHHDWIKWSKYHRGDTGLTHSPTQQCFCPVQLWASAGAWWCSRFLADVCTMLHIWQSELLFGLCLYVYVCYWLAYYWQAPQSHPAELETNESKRVRKDSFALSLIVAFAWIYGVRVGVGKQIQDKAIQELKLKVITWTRGHVCISHHSRHTPIHALLEFMSLKKLLLSQPSTWVLDCYPTSAEMIYAKTPCASKTQSNTNCEPTFCLFMDHPHTIWNGSHIPVSSVLQFCSSDLETI
jgi:hypothetical protein